MATPRSHAAIVCAGWNSNSFAMFTLAVFRLAGFPMPSGIRRVCAPTPALVLTCHRLRAQVEMLQFLATVARGPAQKVEVRFPLLRSRFARNCKLLSIMSREAACQLTTTKTTVHVLGGRANADLRFVHAAGAHPRGVGAVRHQPEHEHAHAGAPVEEVRRGAAGGAGPAQGAPRGRPRRGPRGAPLWWPSPLLERVR